MKKKIVLFLVLLLTMIFSMGLISFESQAISTNGGSDTYGCYNYWTWFHVKIGDDHYYCFYAGHGCTPCIIVTPE